MCELNRIALILLILFACYDWPIWIEIILIILYAVCSLLANKREMEMNEKIENHDLAIQYKKDYIAEISERLDKLEDKINKGE